MGTIRYSYRITYKDVMKRSLPELNSMVLTVQDEDFLKIVRGVADGLDLMDIQGIDHVIKRMEKMSL